MINTNNQINSVPGLSQSIKQNPGPDQATSSQFVDSARDASKLMAKVDDLQEASEISIKDLLAGKNSDITQVVSAVAKADMSFKLLVGVRNKLIEAYKQTMNMQI